MQWLTPLLSFSPLLSSHFILPKQEAHVGTKGHSLHHLACRSHTALFISCTTTSWPMLYGITSVLYFFFTTDYFAATCTRPSLFCLANCYKKQGKVVWWSLNISQGRLFLLRQVSQHSREKNTSSIISIYFSFEGSFINAVSGCQRMSILFKQNKLWNWVFIV